MHPVQPPAFAVLLYVPAGHGEQVPAAEPLYVPAPQGEHEVPMLNVPAPQAEHAYAPTTPLKYPVGQLSQIPLLLYWPIAQLHIFLQYIFDWSRREPNHPWKPTTFSSFWQACKGE